MSIYFTMVLHGSPLHHIPLLSKNRCLVNYTNRFKVTVEGKSYLAFTNSEQFVTQLKYWILVKPSCTPEFIDFDLDHVDVRLVQVSMTNFPNVGGLCNDSSRVPKRYGERSFSRMVESSNNNKFRMNFAGN